MNKSVMFFKRLLCVIAIAQYGAPVVAAPELRAFNPFIAETISKLGQRVAGSPQIPPVAAQSSEPPMSTLAVYLAAWAVPIIATTALSTYVGFSVQKWLLKKEAQVPELNLPQRDQLYNLAGKSPEVIKSVAPTIDALLLQGSAKPVLVHGPAGVGKTFLAHAMGNAIKNRRPWLTGFGFYTISGTELQSPEAIKRLFDTARTKDYSVICIENIEHVAAKQGVDVYAVEPTKDIKRNGHMYTVQDFEQGRDLYSSDPDFAELERLGDKSMWTRLNGPTQASLKQELGHSDQVLCIATTSVPLDKLEPSILNLFSQPIRIDLPDEEQRTHIFRYCQALACWKHGITFNHAERSYGSLARATSGCSYAAIKGAVDAAYAKNSITPASSKQPVADKDILEQLYPQGHVLGGNNKTLFTNQGDQMRASREKKFILDAQAN